MKGATSCYLLSSLKSQNVSMCKLNSKKIYHYRYCCCCHYYYYVFTYNDKNNKYSLQLTSPPPPSNLFFMCLETPNFITQIKIIVIAACNVLISHVKLPLSRVVGLCSYRAWWPLVPTFSSPGTRKC